MMSSIFILFSLNLLLRGKTIPGYLSLGIATLLHPMIGLVMYGTFVFVHIFPDILNFKLKIILINLLKSLSYFIISLFILVPLIIDNLKTAVPDKNALITYTVGIFKHWSHTSPFSWPIGRFIGYGVFLFIALAIALKYIRENRHRLYLYGYLTVTGLTLLGATIFVEIWPLATVAKAQLFRVVVFLSAFAYIFIIKYIYDCILKSRHIAEKFVIMMIPMLFFSRVTIFIGLTSIIILLIYEKHKYYIYQRFKIISKRRFYPYLFLFII